MLTKSQTPVARRMKERNRGAQKRYRDRLKGRLQETEDTVAGMTEELNALRIERVRGQLSRLLTVVRS